MNAVFHLFAPLALAPLWLLLFFTTPRQGLVVRQWKKKPAPEQLVKAQQAAEEWERHEATSC